MEKEITKGDYGYYIYFYLYDENGQAFDVSGGVFRFKAQRYGEKTLKVEGTCSVVDPSGVVAYQVAKGDFDSTGLYRAEVEGSFPTAIRTWNRDLEQKPFTLKVISDLPQ